MQSEANVILADEVAEILGINKSTVTRRAADGRLPYLRKIDGPRGAYIFDRVEIERLAKEKVA
jgi:excisionase family DNA binding protein